MSDVALVSRRELTVRRQKLRQKRQLKFLQAVWRLFCLCSLTGGLVWLATLPNWTIRKPEQIEIEGNKFLSKELIRSLLPISYPESILRVQPQEIAAKLKFYSPIARVTVVRQLFPPKLEIFIAERQPVAIALNSREVNVSARGANVGLLDASGSRMPLADYTNLGLQQKQTAGTSLPLPRLKVIGKHENYRRYWSELYFAASRSPVEVTEIDCQNPNNLILKTDLGKVHFGPFTKRLPEQLQVLDRMRNLPDRVNIGQVAYIDLKNPDLPAVQLHQQ